MRVCVDQEAFGLEPFFPLNCGDRKSLKTVSPERLCSSSSSPASGRSGFPSRPLPTFSSSSLSPALLPFPAAPPP